MESSISNIFPNIICPLLFGNNAVKHQIKGKQHKFAFEQKL